MLRWTERKKPGLLAYNVSGFSCFRKTSTFVVLQLWQTTSIVANETYVKCQKNLKKKVLRNKAFCVRRPSLFSRN